MIDNRGPAGKNSAFSLEVGISPAYHRPVAKAVAQKYLERYAQPEAGIARDIDENYRGVLVVPALAEDISFLDQLLADPAGVLVIVVVNAAEDRPAADHARNAELIEELGGPGPSWRRCRRGELELLVVDRASPGRRLPSGEGVGLARRIGCDIALALIHEGCVTLPWIFTTDADARLPPGYFDCAHDDAGLVIYPFWHELPDDEIDRQAMLHYEIRLRYYVHGLRRARSPYAVHTIGSTLAIRNDVYAAVRGIPRRLAGEDFYLVNKALKLTPVQRQSCAPIQLRPRHSQRTPFGTGPAIHELRNQLLDRSQPTVYSPKSFELLGRWLDTLDHVARTGEPDLTMVEPTLRRCVVALGAERALVAICRENDREQTRRGRLHQWFDALKTLRLIHQLRDAGLDDVDWRRGLDGLGTTADDLDAARAELAAADRAAPRRHGSDGRGGMRPRDGGYIPGDAPLSR